MPTYRECNENAAKLRKHAAGLLELADFIEEKGVKLPSLPYIADHMDYTVWLTAMDSSFDGTKWTATRNDFQTTVNIANFVKTIGSCEKKFESDRLEIVKQFGTINLEGSVTREIVCEKKITKREWVEPETKVVEGHYREEYEWDCHTPSLLGLVKEA